MGCPTAPPPVTAAPAVCHAATPVPTTCQPTSRTTTVSQMVPTTTATRLDLHLQGHSLHPLCSTTVTITPGPASGTLTETPCKRSPPNGHLLHRPKGQLCQGDAWGLATPPAPWLFHLRSWTPCPSPNTWLLLVSSLCLGHSLSWWVYPVLSWQMQHKCHLPQEGFRWQGQGPLLGPAACECPSALALPTLYHPYPGEGSHQGRGLLKAGLAGW